MRHQGSFISVVIIALAASTSLTCTNKQNKNENKANGDVAALARLFESSVYSDDKGNDLPYRYFEPAKANEENAKLPVILYLHGENEAGTDNNAQVTNTECATIWTSPAHLEKNPVYVLAPQIPEGAEWTVEPYYGNTLALLYSFVQSHPAIDPKRIYILGFSMGATGVWNMILKNPSLFAAAMPISGSADPYLGDYDAWSAIKNLPVLVVHSMDDPVYPVSGATNAIKALQAAGNLGAGSAMNSFWGIGSLSSPHDAWYPAFHKYGAIYSWMFEQSLERTNDGAVYPTMLFTWGDLGNGVKRVWDYSLGTAYIIEREDKALIIDAAAGGGSIYQYIRDNVLDNKDIDLELVITHNHDDHILGMASFVGVSQLKKIYVHRDDSAPVKAIMGADSSKIQYITEGDVIPLGGGNAEIINVPGHTWGSVVIRYENNLFTGDAIGSGDLWLPWSIMSVEDYAGSVQHLLNKTGDSKLMVLGGHTGEYASPLTDEYIRDMLACAKGLVDGSIKSAPYWRTFNGQATLGFVGTYGNANILHNLNNIKIIKGALKDLAVSYGSLDPQFAPYNAYYTVRVNEKVSDFVIVPAVLADDYLNLTINGDKVDSGKEYRTKLNKGENRFSIVVTASDNTAKTYTLDVLRGNAGAEP